METTDLTAALYRFIARLDDDPWIDTRVQQHAHLLRQEIKEIHADADKWLPADKGVPPYVPSRSLERP